jgi:hypothetical protein
MSSSKIPSLTHCVVGLLAGVSFVPSAMAGINPDATLFTSYRVDYATTTYSVCGSIPAGLSGCFGGSLIGPFGQIGAMMEGVPTVNSSTSTSTRRLYIVDQSVGGNGSTKVNLNIYKLTIVVDSSSAHTSLDLLRTVALPQLVGGQTAHTYMAANADYVYVGTDQGATAMRVARTTFAKSAITLSVPSLNVSSITVDGYGFVNVGFGGLAGGSGVRQFDPSGTDMGERSGSYFKLGMSQGLSTSDVKPGPLAAAPFVVKYVPNALAVPSNSKPDAGLSIDYAFDPAFTMLNYVVCGSVAGSSGCYANGTIDTFGHIGAVVSSSSTRVNGQTVRRNLYVVDQAVGGGASTSVALDSYQITEQVVAPNVIGSVKKLATIPLPLVGGAQAKSWIVGNQVELGVGTNQNTFSEMVSKASLYSYPINPSGTLKVSLVTTSNRGDIAFDSGGISGGGAFEMFDPKGNLEFYGGGQQFDLGTEVALSIADLQVVAASASAPTQIHVASTRSK